jgi:two-component system phosphate regulon response regulator OmpR
MTPDAPHILVVDDDERLRALLNRFLSENGFRVSAAADAAEARAVMEGLTPDLMVLDVMMPGEDGVSLTRAMRSGDAPGGDVPVLMLTAMGDAEARIGGLESGADDYLAKPFEPRELLLRIRTILRRMAPTETAPIARSEVSELWFGDFRFDMRQNILWKVEGAEEITVRLTEAELSLLRCFAEVPGETLGREDLVERSAVNGGERTVDVQITRLRRKIEPDLKYPRFLQTVRGRGYVFRPDS